jgi:hypothetical protein
MDPHWFNCSNYLMQLYLKKFDRVGDKKELSAYKSQLWKNKMTEDMSIFKFYTTTKEIVQNIKTISKQKPCSLSIGFKKPILRVRKCGLPEKNLKKHMQFAVLCKFTSNEKTSANMASKFKL